VLHERHLYCMINTVLSAQGLVMKFGGITATNNVTLNLQKGARHALDRPQRRRQNHAHQPVDRRAATYQQAASSSKGKTSRIWHRTSVCGRGMVRTFQINQLFDSMSPMQTLAMVVSREHKGLGGKWWQALGADRSVVERCEQLLEQFHLSSVMRRKPRVLAYGKRRLLEIAIALGLRAPRTSARRTGGRCACR